MPTARAARLIPLHLKITKHPGNLVTAPHKSLCVAARIIINQSDNLVGASCPTPCPAAVCNIFNQSGNLVTAFCTNPCPAAARNIITHSGNLVTACAKLLALLIGARNIINHSGNHRLSRITPPLHRISQPVFLCY